MVTQAIIHKAASVCAALLSMSLPNAQHACKHMETVVEASEFHDIDPLLLVSLIYEESTWKPEAVSKAKACGLTQVIPKYTRPRLSCRALRNPTTSIWVGAKTLNKWIYRYGRGNKALGLCGYNAGYRCKGKNAVVSGKMYARRVLRFTEKLEEVMLKRYVEAAMAKAAAARARVMRAEADRIIIRLQRQAIGYP